MELVDGQDLRAAMRHSPCRSTELAVIGAGIADALAYVHSLGIIHRDIKPANILLVQVRPGEPLRPKLTDFGIARIMDATRLTATGTMVGTAAYLSPEQSRGADLAPATTSTHWAWSCSNASREKSNTPAAPWNPPWPACTAHRKSPMPSRRMGRPDPGHDRPGPAWTGRPPRTSKWRCGRPWSPPESLPGLLAEDRTRVLPAPPARPPRLPSAAPAGGTGHTRPTRSARQGARPLALHLLDPDAVTSPRPGFLCGPDRLPLPAGPPPHPGPAVRSRCWPSNGWCRRGCRPRGPEPPAVVPYPA